MLHEFLAENHDELVKRCLAKVATRPAFDSRPGQNEYGIPILLDQLVRTLRAEGPEGLEPNTLPTEIGNTAREHGNELLLRGFSVDQVVHDYGDLCQAVTELAHETDAKISVDEFHTFNRCLDNAIADAVTEFGRQRDALVSEADAHTLNERLGFLAHELRNLLNSAMLAFHAIKGGNGTVGGATGTVLSRNLLGLRDLIDRSLADVRLTEGLAVRRERIVIGELIDDLQISASLEATSRGIVLSVPTDHGGLAVDADRQMLSSALANLLQNALKFTPRDGRVSLTVRLVNEHVIINVEDECGGLPPGTTEELFQPYSQRSSDRSGLGLGLSISRRGVEASGGKLSVRDLKGKGCIFTIDLPQSPPATIVNDTTKT